MMVFSRNYLGKEDSIFRAMRLEKMVDSDVTVLYDGDISGMPDNFVQHRHHWCDMMLKHFLDFKFDYALFSEYDVLHIRKGLDSESFRHMKENGIDLLTQELVVVHEGMKHPFIGKGCKPGDVFCGLAHFAISREALEWWVNNWYKDRNFNWMEIDLPNVLKKHGAKVVESPFVSKRYLRWLPNGADFNEGDVALAYDEGSYAVHPIKSIESYRRLSESYR